jgi:hypothetical protein
VPKKGSQSTYSRYSKLSHFEDCFYREGTFRVLELALRRKDPMRERRPELDVLWEWCSRRFCRRGRLDITLLVRLDLLFHLCEERKSVWASSGGYL